MRPLQPVIAILLCCFILGAGCTGPEKEVGDMTPVPARTMPEPVPVTESPPISPTPEAEPEASVFDMPVTVPPANLTVSVSVRKDPVYSTITVVFDGGKGQDLVQSIPVRTIRSTGEVSDDMLGKEKGAELTINGTRGTDLVRVGIHFMNGDSYHLSDTSLAPSREITGTVTPVPEKTMSINEEGLYPGPVTIPPNSLSVSVEVEKEPIYRVITGTFRGGHGQFLVSRIDMNAVLGTGEAVTKEIPHNIGGMAEIQGTDGVDRVQVVVRFKNGEVHKILEKALGPRG